MYSVLRNFVDNTEKPLRYHQGDIVVVFQYYQHGGDMEVSGGDFKFPSHSLHQLSKISLRIPVRLWHTHRHFQDQTALSVSGLEGGGHVRDLSGPEQDV